MSLRAFELRFREQVELKTVVAAQAALPYTVESVCCS